MTGRVRGWLYGTYYGNMYVFLFFQEVIENETEALKNCGSRAYPNAFINNSKKT